MKQTHPDPRSGDRLDWNLLRTFLVIVQERSISGAAAKLHLTQSAVSQALKRLEEQLDRRLVERHNQAFTVTNAGEEVRRAAEAIYGNVAQLLTDVSQTEVEASGRIHLLVASRIHSQVYDNFWAAFHAAYPRIEVQLDVLPSSEIVTLMQQRVGTAGIALCRQMPKRLENKVFLHQRYALFCGRNHALFGRQDLRIEDLMGENFVSFASDALGDSLSPLTIFRDQRGFQGGWWRRRRSMTRSSVCSSRVSASVACPSTACGATWPRAGCGVCRPAKGVFGRPAPAVASRCAAQPRRKSLPDALSRLYRWVHHGRAAGVRQPAAALTRAAGWGYQRGAIRMPSRTCLNIVTAAGIAPRWVAQAMRTRPCGSGSSA